MNSDGGAEVPGSLFFVTTLPNTLFRSFHRHIRDGYYVLHTSADPSHSRAQAVRKLTRMGVNPESQWIASRCDSHIRQDRASVFPEELHAPFHAGRRSFTICKECSMETNSKEHRHAVSCDRIFRLYNGDLEAKRRRQCPRGK